MSCSWWNCWENVSKDAFSAPCSCHTLKTVKKILCLTSPPTLLLLLVPHSCSGWNSILSKLSDCLASPLSFPILLAESHRGNLEVLRPLRTNMGLSGLRYLQRLFWERWDSVYLKPETEKNPHACCLSVQGVVLDYSHATAVYDALHFWCSNRWDHTGVVGPN